MNAYLVHRLSNVTVDTRTCAEILDIKPQTLRLWRSAGRGPRFDRSGAGKVRYRMQDIAAWHSENTL